MSMDEATTTAPDETPARAAPSEPTRPGYAEALRATSPVRTVIGVIVANVLGAFVVAVYMALAGQPDEVSDGERATAAIILAAVLVAAVIVTAGLGRRAAQPVIDWLRADRGGSEEEGLLAISLPVRLTIVVFGWWVLATLVMLLVNGVLLDTPSDYVWQFALATFLGGLVATAVAFVVLSRLTLPVFRVGVQAGVPQKARFGFLAYLTLVWLMVAAVPLLLVTATTITADDGERVDRPATLLTVAIVSILVGLVVVWWVARSVSRPVAGVRGGLGLLGAGELTDITVDEGGDLGLLEGDFNLTVARLRERKYMEDLFGRYVGIDAARDAIARNVPLTGEVREASVLYAELIDSSSYSDQMRPEEVVGVLNEFFAAVYASATAEGGWVSMFDGDSAMCVFGPPNERPEHASNALNAARRLRDALDEVQARHPIVDGAVGVASGWVVAGTVGTETLFEYRVIGDPMIEAVGLCEAAKEQPGRVLASGWSTAHATEQAIDWAPVGEVHVKSRPTPTRTFAPVAR